LVNNLIDYFSLYRQVPVLGKSGTENRRQIQLYLGVLAGAACKVIYDVVSANSPPRWQAFIIALIISLVVFPQLYYSGGLNKRKLSFAHWALAFQNGFFFNVAFGELAKTMGNP
jgi:hypothetical protein